MSKSAGWDEREGDIRGGVAGELMALRLVAAGGAEYKVERRNRDWARRIIARNRIPALALASQTSLPRIGRFHQEVMLRQAVRWDGWWRGLRRAWVGAEFSCNDVPDEFAATGAG